MPYDILEEAAPESGGFEILEEQEPPGELAGIVNSFRRGNLAAQRAIEAVQMTPEQGPTMRQGRRGFVQAMEDPRYLNRLMTAGDDAEALRMAESLYGPGRRVEAMTDPRRQANIATAQNISELSKQADAIPQSAAMQEWAQANNSNWWKVFARNPVEITANIFAESLPQAAPSMAATMATGGIDRVASAAAGGAGSFGIEAANSLVDAAASQGVDLHDPEQVRGFFADENKVKAVREFALRRGLPIGLLDALTVGVAGKFLKPALGQGAARVAGATAAEAGMQMAVGAGGEALAQVTSGQDLNVRDIAAEAIGELATAPGEVVSNLREEFRNKPAVKGQVAPSDNPKVAEIEAALNKPTVEDLKALEAAMRGNQLKPAEAKPATADPALAEVVAALRGENPAAPRLKGALPKVEPQPAAPVEQDNSTAQTVVQQPTEEMRAAMEFQKRTDEAVRAALKNPDKNYDAMTRQELEMLDSLGDAQAKAALRRMPRQPAAAATSGKTILTGEGFRKRLNELNGDMPQADLELVATPVQAAIDNGQRVTLIADGKPIPIVAVANGMLEDEKGQRWGTFGIATDRSGNWRLEIDGPQTPPPIPANLEPAEPTTELPQISSKVVEPKPETDSARVRREAKEFDKLLLDYGIEAVRPPGKADSVERALDKLKIETPPGSLQAFGLLPEMWNGLVEAVRLAYRGGKSIAQAIEDGLAWLQATHGEQQFDEAAVRAELQSIVHGADADKPATIRAQLNNLGAEMDAIRARGEEIPQAMLDQYKELADTLAEEIRSGRETTGQGRIRVDENLKENPQRRAAGGAAYQIPQWRGEQRLPAGRLRDLFTGLKGWRERAGNWLARRQERMDVTIGRDAADNRAMQSANEASQHVRLVLNRAFDTAPGEVRVKHETREAALTFVVEADGDRAKLAEFHEQIATSEFSETKAARQAMAAIEYAEAHWKKLQQAAERYRVLSEAERETELNEGVNSAEWRGGYVYHRWAKESPSGGADPTQSTPAGTPFRKSRSVATYAEGIAAGRKPQTLNALELLAERVAAGQRRLNELSWVYGLRNMIDPVTDMPVVVDVIKKPRRPVNLPAPGSPAAQAMEAAGETYKPEWQTIAPEGYKLWRLGDLEVAVQENFAGLLTKLTAPSFFKGAGVKKAFGALKSALLMFDTFHLGRMVAWRQMFGLFGGYQKGQTLLDFSTADIREMAARGEIPEAWADGLIENKRRLNLAIRTGFNIGNVLDNSWGDALHNLPGIGTFNKWLFGQYQRGAMAEAWLIEFERMSRALPNVPEAKVARRVSADLNARFGNLNRQGWIKSRTMQDLVRFVFLAPQWNESLIRSELGAIGQAIKAPIESVQQRRLVYGTLMKATGLMAVGTFLANQILNFAFRGKPTWDNDEEEWDKKISAYIPDAIGGGPGFFLNPLALPMEYTHLLEGNLHRSGGDLSEAGRRILVSRLHAGMRPVEIFLNRKDPLGRKLRDGEVLPAMAKALIPAPIASGTVLAAGKQLVTGEPSEQFPGQYQKQLMASFGVKTDQAPSPEQRIRNLAREFNKAKGIEPSAEFYAGDYDELNKALRIGNEIDARAAFDELLKKRTPREVYDHYKRAAVAPFTGQKGREKEFWRGLTPKQREVYEQARAARRDTSLRAVELLREVMATPAR